MDIGQDPNRPARLYVDGVFDCTHFGHLRLFEQCKKKFPHVYLIVGVAGDEECTSYKNSTIMTQFERSELIKHCKWVDEVICPCPWIVNQDFVDAMEIDFVCHDDAVYTYGSQDGDIYAFVKKIGKFIATQRTQGVSTTDLIKRIVCNADYFSAKVLKAEQVVNEQEIKEVTNKAVALKELYENVVTKDASD